MKTTVDIIGFIIGVIILLTTAFLAWRMPINSTRLDTNSLPLIESYQDGPYSEYKYREESK